MRVFYSAGRRTPGLVTAACLALRTRERGGSLEINSVVTRRQPTGGLEDPTIRLTPSSAVALSVLLQGHTAPCRADE